MKVTRLAITLQFLFTLFFTKSLFSQAYPFEKWDHPTLTQANIAADVNYLTLEEKKVIFYSNLARLNPTLFEQTYLQWYLDSMSMKETGYVKSLKKTLRKMESLEAMQPREDLYEAALYHASAMGQSGKTGHNKFKQRTAKLIKTYRRIGENCDYGNADAIHIVMRLLIDEGISDLGHRKNILSPGFKYVGNAIRPHKKHRYNCVMEFGGD